MHSIGPYRFTETDAQRTVGNLDAIWGLYAHDRDAGVLEPLYPTLTGDLATDLQRVWAAWCAAGGVYCIAGLRGGYEYGEAWHHAGRRANKQRVFDDFHAAADWLVAQGYTARERMAVHGGSNGGVFCGENAGGVIFC